MRVTEQFPRSSDQIPRARALVWSTLRAWGVSTGAEDLLLVASELFTNAVLHGAGHVEVTLERLRHAVRLEVVDGGHPDARAPLAPVEPGMFSGRGLAIVAKVASDWGSAVGTRGGTRVWAEIPC